MPSWYGGLGKHKKKEGDKIPKITENYIHLENPDHPESDFRMKPGTTNTINVVGSSTFGKGIIARYGLLKGTGGSAIITYLFPVDKFDLPAAKKWLDDHKQKVEKEELINKDFTIVMPVTKQWENEEGTLFLKGEASNTDLDLQEDQMETSAIQDMKEQCIGKTGFLNHTYDIGKTDFGIIVGYEKSEDKFIPIFEVFDDMKQIIKNRISKGAKLGLSIGGKVTDAIKEAGKRIIKSVLLREVSLTYFPANIGTLGTVGMTKEGYPCMGGICKQVFKSIDQFEGGIDIVKSINITREDENIKNIQKAVRDEKDSYEALRDKIRVAVNQKYTIGDRTKFWVQNTYPDAVIVESYDEDKLYEIPYTIDDEGNVQLSDPVEVSEQYVSKKMKEGREQLIKLLKGDDKVGKEIEIPEGVQLDKEVVEKLEGVKKDNKAIDFIKGLFGIKDEPNPSPITKTETDPDPEKFDKSQVMKDINDIKKKNDELEQSVYKLQKSNDEKDKTIKTLIDERDEAKKTAKETEHNDLVTKAIDSYKVLKEEGVKDEDSLKEYLEKNEGYTKEEIEKDVDGCLKTVIKANEKAASKIKKHPGPAITNPLLDKEHDEYKERADAMRKEMESHGTTQVKKGEKIN